MAAVRIDSGEFPLMRNVDTAYQPNRAKIYNDWSRAFNDQVPDAIDHLADVIEDVYAFELWKDKYLATPEEFFERIGLFDLDLKEPAKLIAELRKKNSSKKAEIVRRAAKAKELREHGLTQRAIAEELGVSQPTVVTDLSENSVPAEKPDKAKRDHTEVRLRPGTAPEQAAQRIREKFGDEYAESLATAIQENQHD